MVYQFFDKKTGSGVSVPEQQAEELHKTVIKKFKRTKVYARFTDNTWAADLAEIESLSSSNRKVKSLLCVMFSLNMHGLKVKPLNNKKGKTVLNAFIKIVNESNHEPEKLWVDQGRESYNKLTQEWLDNNDISVCSSHNEVKSITAERFIKT